MSVVCCVKNGFVTLMEENPVPVRKSFTLGDIIMSHLDFTTEHSVIDTKSPMSEASTCISFCSRSSVSTVTSSVVSEKSEAPWRKLKSFAAKNQVESSDKTTVMIRNIPGLYTVECLVEEVRQTGNQCNFAHLPLTKKGDFNLGYAFVNFLTPEMARDFLEVFEGHQFLKHESSKVAEVDYASMQGFDANVEFYSKRRITKTKRAPWVLRQ
jgi:hypothetical protein